MRRCCVYKEDTGFMPRTHCIACNRLVGRLCCGSYGERSRENSDSMKAAGLGSYTLVRGTICEDCK